MAKQFTRPDEYKNKNHFDQATRHQIDNKFKVIVTSTVVNAHGRLMLPPARNAMWRFGFPNPVNYNDNELFCGGYAVQWEQNLGKCGVCGDAYHVQTPRPHEAGGDYAKGIISQYYSAGQVRR